MAKQILWNEEAVAQGADELEPDQVNCPDCGTSPRLRQFGRLRASAGSWKELSEGRTRLRGVSLPPYGPIQARHPLSRPGLPPGMMRNRSRVLWVPPQQVEAQAIEVAASFAPEELQDSVASGEFDSLTPAQRRKIYEGLGTTILAAGELVHRLLQKDSFGAALVVLAYLFALYKLRNEFEDV